MHKYQFSKNPLCQKDFSIGFHILDWGLRCPGIVVVVVAIDEFVDACVPRCILSQRYKFSQTLFVRGRLFHRIFFIEFELRSMELGFRCWLLMFMFIFISRTKRRLARGRDDFSGLVMVWKRRLIVGGGGYLFC